MQQTGFAAVLGAAAGMLLVIGISLRERRVSAFTLLLTGVTLNSMAFAVILFLHSTASFSQAFRPREPELQITYSGSLFPARLAEI